MITIQKATQKDLPLILHFIKSLALYEKMLDEVKASEESLNEWLFIKQQAFVLIAYFDEKPVGFALYFYNFSTFLGKCGIYLEDLFVEEEYRNKGIGKALFKELAKIAKDNNFERLDFCCLNDNYPSLAFYEKIGAKRLSEWGILRLDKNALNSINSLI